MAHKAFDEKKSRILQQLSVPEEDYTDASPKGSVDGPIRALVNSINQISSLVTTSSCSGRISVYVEGRGKPQRSTDDVGLYETLSTSGKGGGRWTFVSHEAVDMSALEPEVPTPIHKLFKLQQTDGQHLTSEDMQRSFVHFKFEPMILHILTASPSDAQHVLGAALQAGFRESGATSLVTSPMVAIRSSGLMLDSVIGYQSDDEQLFSIVSEQYLHTLVDLANQRFTVNQKRIERFAEALMEAFTVTSNRSDRDQRREENRRQGQLRQAQYRAEAAPSQIIGDNWTELLADANHLDT